MADQKVNYNKTYVIEMLRTSKVTALSNTIFCIMLVCLNS